MNATATHPSPTVPMFIGAGLFFEVPRTQYYEALLGAMRSRKVMLIGIRPDGSCEVSPDGMYLRSQGCDTFGIVTPGDAAI